MKPTGPMCNLASQLRFSSWSIRIRMTKLIAFAILSLFAVLATSFMASSQVEPNDEVNELRYPKRPMLETLMARPLPTPKDMDKLEYPKESLISSLLSRLFGAFTRISVSIKIFAR